MEKINRKIIESREFAFKNADMIVAIKLELAKNVFTTILFVYLFSSLVVAGRLSDSYPFLRIIPLLVYPLFAFSVLAFVYALVEYRYRNAFVRTPSTRYAILLSLVFVYLVVVVGHLNYI